MPESLPLQVYVPPKNFSLQSIFSLINISILSNISSTEERSVLFRSKVFFQLISAF